MLPPHSVFFQGSISAARASKPGLSLSLALAQSRAPRLSGLGGGRSQAEPAQHKAPLSLLLGIFLCNLDFLLFLCCSDTEAQCEVMQEIVDQVLEVTAQICRLTGRAERPDWCGLGSSAPRAATK